MRTIEQEALRKFFESEGAKPAVASDAATACRDYLADLDRRGIMSASDAEVGAQGERLHVTIGETCPYRKTCGWIHDEGGAVHCFRAVAMSEMLRIALRRSHAWTLDAFGLPCEITLRPLHLEADDDGH